MAELDVQVSDVVYAKEDFYILDLTIVSSRDSPFTSRTTKARGNLHGLKQIKTGVTICLLGEWVVHAKYGRQFLIKGWQPWARTTSEIEVFLHLCIRGFVDMPVAKAFVRRFGLETFVALSQDPVADIEATPELVQNAYFGWKRTLAAQALANLLGAGGMSSWEIQALLTYFGTSAAEVLHANPYRMLEVPGISFEKADLMAKEFGLPQGDPRRIEGATLWSLQEAANEGHLFLRRSEIPGQILSIPHKQLAYPLSLGASAKELVETAVQSLQTQRAVVLDSEAGVYLPAPYRFERESAAKMVSTMQTQGASFNIDPEKFIAEFEHASGILFSENQKDAVRKLVAHRMLVLTGLPGTGKTLLTRAFVRLFEEAKLSFLLLAPTGIAAKRLENVTRRKASTIHRALRYDGSAWGYHATNRLMVDAVVVDETSMVDQELIYRLLDALPPETALVLVGDDAQLPSVGAGNVLRELVSCPSIPTTRLTQIFRQSEEGDIVSNSHRVNRGEKPVLARHNSGSEFCFVPMQDEEKIAATVVEMAVRLKAKDANFQILSPKYAGDVGVTSLNEKLRDQLNPRIGQMEWKGGSLDLRIGDRLMVVRNDYKLNVYNGDVGKLIRIGRDKTLVVRIHGAGSGDDDREVEFPEHDAEGKLQLAYAVTVHKSQGQEFDTIILPIVKSQGWMLQRNLLYTAITRARKKVWLIGEEGAIEKAIVNNQVIHRNTALARVLGQLLSQPSDAVV